MSAIDVHRCIKPFLHHLPLSVCAAPSGGAASEEGKDARCALDVGSSFGSSGANGMDDADLAAIGAAFDWDYGVDDVEDSDRWVYGGGGGGGV